MGAILSRFVRRTETMLNTHSRMMILLVAVALITFGLTLVANAWLSEPAGMDPDWMPPTAVSTITSTTTVLNKVSTVPAVTPLVVAVQQTFTPIPSATATPLPSPTAIPTATPTQTPAPDYTPTPLPTPTTAVWPTPFNEISRTVRVPILMYHYVSTPPEDADKYRIDLSVEPALLRQQLTYLAENGFTAIDLYDLSLAISNKRALPDKPIILTFDDGYIDNYENAYPLLEEFGFQGTFFVITDFVDQNHPAYMSWDMLRELHAAGHRIESHTLNHPDLSQMSREGMYGQIAGAQQAIAEQIGHTPRYLCYPGGRYDETTIEVLQELDLWGAVTTQGGRWHGFEDRYEWRRVRISYDTNMEDFIRAIEPSE